MEALTEILKAFNNYLAQLDWAYVFTFILIAYFINAQKVRRVFIQVINVKISTRYRVALIGLLYGVLVFFLRGAQWELIEGLLQSFVFAMVFHKLIIDTIMRNTFLKLKTTREHGTDKN